MEEKPWFLYVVDHHEGPFSEAEIRELLSKEEARLTSFVWKEGFEDWKMISEVQIFQQGEEEPALEVVTNEVLEDAGSKAPEAEPSTSILTAALSNAWCLFSSGKYSGPHSLDDLAIMFKQKKIIPADQVWTEGWTHFKKVSDYSPLLQELQKNNITLEESKPELTITPQQVILQSPPSSPSPKVQLSKPRALPTMSTRGKKKTSALTKFAILILVCGGVYQLWSLGYLAPLASHLAFLKVPFEDGIKKISQYVPKPLQKYVFGLEIPEDLSALDQEVLRQILLTRIEEKEMLDVFLPEGESMSPAFWIVTNAASQRVEVDLKGKPGTLLNALHYNERKTLTMENGVLKTPAFCLEGSKPLPKGEYIVTVRLSNAENGSPNGLVYSKHFFLGGVRDANYQTRLQEYKDRLQKQYQDELAQAKQMLLLVESIANESASRFSDFAKLKKPALKKKEWELYHEKYLKIAEQAQLSLKRLQQAALKQTSELQGFTQVIWNVFELTQDLHQSQHQWTIQQNKELFEQIQQKAGEAASKIAQAKQAMQALPAQYPLGAG